MQTFTMIAQVLLALSILVAIHELGHFLAARMFGMRVDKFYIFFDFGKKKLFSFKRGHTEYGIGWFPLGGYVKISGMIDESMDKEQLNKPPQPWEFRSKPAWQRLIVMIAGVFMNLVLGIIIFSIMSFHYGESYKPIKENNFGIVAYDFGEDVGFKTGDVITEINGQSIYDFRDFSEIFRFQVLFADNAKVTVLRDSEEEVIELPEDFLNRFADDNQANFISERIKFKVGNLQPKSNAKKAGIEKGDIIVKVNSDTIIYFDQFKTILDSNKEKTIEILVLRDDKPIKINNVKVTAEGTIGFQVVDNGYIETEHYGFFESFAVGNKKAWVTLKEQVLGFGKLITGKVNPRKALGGPIKIATYFGGVWDWQNFWFWSGLLSLILAFMNLLPIPALDGGHVITIFIEMITGRPLNTKAMEIIQTIGIIIIFALMLFVIVNDTWDLISK
jgi:regulator of sigma E protease